MRRWVLLTVTALLACPGPTVNRVQPQLRVPEAPIDFGTLPVLNQKKLEVPLLNVGRATLKVIAVALATEDGIFHLTPAPVEVASGNTENVVVTFTPVKEAPYANTLIIDTDDLDNPHLELPLTGAGLTAAKLGFMPAMLDFARVAECAGTVAQVTLTSVGTADLIITEIGFTTETFSGFGFVGSTKTPATVKITGANGLPGQIQLTVRLTVPAGTTGPVTGGIHLKTTDPDQVDVVIPMTATINRAPVGVIAMLGNSSPGELVSLDGSGSSDPDGDSPITFKWTIRSKPLSSTTAINEPTRALTSMRLDPLVPGAYEVQLDLTDSTGVKSCTPARATVVAAPAQKLLVEMFWDNPGTDLDLHVLKAEASGLFSVTDDCFFQNRKPMWGVTPADNPELVRDALTGYGPEVFGYQNPIDSTYRAVVVFNSELLSATPQSKATVRVYEFGVLKGEFSKTLTKANEVWEVAFVTWPSGVIREIP